MRPPRPSAAPMFKLVQNQPQHELLATMQLRSQRQFPQQGQPVPQQGVPLQFQQVPPLWPVEQQPFSLPPQWAPQPYAAPQWPPQACYPAPPLIPQLPSVSQHRPGQSTEPAPPPKPSKRKPSRQATSLPKSSPLVPPRRQVAPTRSAVELRPRTPSKQRPHHPKYYDYDSDEETGSEAAEPHTKKQITAEDVRGVETEQGLACKEDDLEDLGGCMCK